MRNYFLPNRIKYIAVLFSFAIFIAIFSFHAGCGKRSLPPEEFFKVQLLWPLQDDVVNNLSLDFDWEVFPGAQSYAILIWRSGVSEPIFDEIATISKIKVDIELLDGEYRWAVGVNAGNETKYWSDTVSFHVSQVVLTNAPSREAIINSTRVFFDWYNFPHANGYKILVWKRGSPADVVFEGYSFSSSINPSVPFFDGSYCWSVGVQYSEEIGFTRWSDTICFSIDQSPYKIVDTMNTRGYPRDVYPYGNFLFVGDGSAGLLVCDRSEPSNPIPLLWDEPPNQYESRAIWVDPVWKIMAVADYRGNPPLLIYDIINPQTPILRSWAGIWVRRSQDVDGIWFRDTLFLAIADYDDGAFLYDLHDTTGYATSRGILRPNGFTYGVALKDTLLFTAAGQVGVFISHILSPETVLSNINTPGEAYRIAFSGNYCFVADGLAGISVIDFSDPRNARLAGRADVQVGSAQDIKIHGNLCFLANGSGGTLIYDISNPTNPVPIQQIEGTYSYAVAFDGDILYIADRDWGIVTLVR